MKKYVRRTLRRSEELRRLNKDHGVQAIGVYWILIEALEESETSGTLKLEQLHSISSEFGISLSLLELVVFDYGLFDYTDTEFFDDQLRLSRLHEQSVSAKRRAAACKRWHKKSSSIESVPPVYPSSCDAKADQKRENQMQKHESFRPSMQKHNETQSEDNEWFMQLHKNLEVSAMQLHKTLNANAVFLDFPQKKEKKQKKENNIININYYIYTSKEKEKEKDFFEKQEKEKSEQRSTIKVESTRKEKGCAEKEKRSVDFFQAPALHEIQDYVKKKTYHIDPNSFFSYYQSIGWKVGSKKMANWQAAIDSWEYRHLQSPTLSNQSKRTHHNNLDIKSLWSERSHIQRVHG